MFLMKMGIVASENIYIFFCGNQTLHQLKYSFNVQIVAIRGVTVHENDGFVHTLVWMSQFGKLFLFS